mgnify:CR=1 FL=1
MSENQNFSLVCPIRGALSTTGRSANGLKPIEEFYRVQAIQHLISLGYPPDNFKVEMVMKKFGNSGRNSFRCDFVVLDAPVNSIKNDTDELLKHAIVLCEVKRSNAKSDYVKATQVKPMLDFAKRSDTIGIYWSDIEQRVFWQEEQSGIKQEKEGPISLVPVYGQKNSCQASYIFEHSTIKISHRRVREN